MSKIEEFTQEFRILLKKYDVSLVKEIWSDEYGHHSDFFFQIPGSVNNRYAPRYSVHNQGYCGMGG